MDQRNAQAIVLEALRQTGFLRSEGDNGHKCSQCCAASQAVETLAKFAVASGRPVHHFVIASVERPLIEKALMRTGGNQVAAARLLGIHRNSLRARMRALGIRPVKPSGFVDQAAG
jgi:DNA-binding protein Fis